ncbi:MAG: non-canonical purine NTP pyrophosphatase [bacterium]|nr:non-canonical purine NTP pyrophosphatase [bacterium]
MKTSSITFITGNAAKAKQLKWHLGRETLHKKLDLPEIQSLNLREIVERKAKDAYEIIKSPVLVEDTSLVFKALGKLPGPLIKWFYEELGNEGICRIFAGQRNKSFIAEVCFGLYDGKELKTFSGKVYGTVAAKPRGKSGFGWDPIFIPKGYKKTWGEMSTEEQKKTSMRRIALKKLEIFLKK